MAERYSGVVGSKLELYFYGRSSAGVYTSLYNVGSVYIYPSDPVKNWAGNVVIDSPFGASINVPGMNKLSDTSVDFLTSGVTVGNYVEIGSGNNVGKYKIVSVLAHMIEIEGSFLAVDANINYEVTKLKTILIPTEIADGTYMVEWDVPADEAGGYYFDLWKNIKATYLSTAYDVVQSSYITKTLPYYIAGDEVALGDRNTSRIGMDAMINMFFRESPLSAPSDPYSITAVNLYRYDPSEGSTPAVNSVVGSSDSGDLYNLIDLTQDFSALSPVLTKYDAVEITAPSSIAGFYRLDSITNATTIRLLDPIGAYVPSGIEYKIHYMYHLDETKIVKVGPGEYNLVFSVPSDIAVGKWWDKWEYVPDAGTLFSDITYNFNDSPPYDLSDPTILEVDAGGNNLAQLTDQGGGVYSFLKPYIKAATPFALSDPYYIQGVTIVEGATNDGSNEYSIEVNGTDLWFNGTEWVTNTGFLCEGTSFWTACAAYWPMDSNWVDTRRSNDGTRSGGGTAFTVGSTYFSGNAGTFNGTTDYVEVPTNSSLWIDDISFSFTFVFNTTGSAEQVLAMKGYKADSASGSPGWVIGTSASGNVFLRAGDASEGGAYGHALISSSTYRDGNDHSCVISIERDGLNTNVNLIVDGVIDGTLTASGSTLMLGNNYPLLFGVDYNDGGYDQLFYSGKLSGFGIIPNTVLTVSDSKKIMADGFNNKHSLTKELFNAHIMELIFQDGDTVNPVIYFISDGTQAQQVDQLDTRWLYYTPYAASVSVGELNINSADYAAAPGEIDSCAVVGQLLKLGGGYMEDELIIAYLADDPTSVEGLLVGNSSFEVRSDINGYFQMYLPQNINVWLSVPSVGFRKKVKIPAATKVSFSELTK